MKKEKIILVLNGKLPKKNDLHLFLKKYNKIICADGAANKVLQTKLKPDLIMGDLDSIKKSILKKYNDRIINLADQNYNDFQKILKWLKNKNYHKIDIIGMDGKRVDHLIGNFSIILKGISDFDLTIFTEFGVFYTVYKKRIFKKCKGQYFSIFSLNKNNKITTIGLNYELNNKSLKSLEQGTLNIANKSNVRIESNDNILVFITDATFKKN